MLNNLIKVKRSDLDAKKIEIMEQKAEKNPFWHSHISTAYSTFIIVIIFAFIIVIILKICMYLMYIMCLLLLIFIIIFVGEKVVYFFILKININKNSWGIWISLMLIVIINGLKNVIFISPLPVWLASRPGTILLL